MTFAESQSRRSNAVARATKGLSSNALVVIDEEVSTKEPANANANATELDPIVLSSDEESDTENVVPGTVASSSYPPPIRDCNEYTGKPKALVVSVEKPKAKGRHLASLSDDSDSEDDDWIFGTGSVFDKNYRHNTFQRKKAFVRAKSDQATPMKHEAKQSAFENQVGRMQKNESVTGSNQNKVLPGLPRSAAELTPNAKQAIRERDFATTMSVTDDKDHNTKKELPKMITSADPKKRTRKLKQQDKQTEVTPRTIVEPKLTPEQIKEERRCHLKSIRNIRDRAVQLLLWEIGFSYNVYAHQFDAVLFVAGLNSKFPHSANGSSLTSEDCPTGAHRRATILQQAAKEFLLRENGSNPPPGGWVHILPTKGMLLADEMGLGKTIEALAGAALRNAMLAYDHDHSSLPTLIVSPQDGIQSQWYETLLKSGVQPSRIMVWGESNVQSKRQQFQHFDQKGNGDSRGETQEDRSNHCGRNMQSYVLCTRYNIQSELRKLFQKVAAALGGDKNRINRTEKDINEFKATTLFRKVPLLLIAKLQNQYQANKGKAKNKFLDDKEKLQDCVARLVKNRTSSRRYYGQEGNGDQRNILQFTFQTIIVDEAHFCKNVLAYWGLGLAMLGTQARRTVLLTGTPYNNGPSDMTALMTYIDPSHKAASIKWWEEAVASCGNEGIHHLHAADDVSMWRKAYLLRRTKDVLLRKLPPRIRTEIDVGAIPSELWIYEAYEAMFMSSLRKLRNNMEARTPEARHRAKKTFEIMMACMASMRMALVHPILPGGREMTIQFSPSRKHLLKREERPKRCILCNSNPTRAAEKEAKKKATRNGAGGDPHHQQMHEQNNNEDDDLRDLVGTARTEMDLDDDELDDDDNYEAKTKREREAEEKKKGPIVPLGPEFCQASGTSCQHFAHTKCIEAHRKEYLFSCPRCHDLKSRLHGQLPHNMYCQEISTHIDDSYTGGFTASAKIEKAVDWFQTSVPRNEKAIFLSFFKGSLDLIEGILVSKLGIDCARYDGDVGKEVRTRDLQRFKTSSACRVLLATVQSGGTGLNITEANHVCFLDRWFNPCVHDQAESRCHRIGQKKEVNIAYLDINCSIDIVMKRINVLKEGNASVILADGTSLGDRWSLGYRNVSGVIGETMKALVGMREQLVQNNGDAPLPPYKESDLEERLANSKGKPNVKREESDQKPEFLQIAPNMEAIVGTMLAAEAETKKLKVQKSNEVRLLSDTTNIEALGSTTTSSSTGTMIGYTSSIHRSIARPMTTASSQNQPVSNFPLKASLSRPHAEGATKPRMPTTTTNTSTNTTDSTYPSHGNRSASMAVARSRGYGMTPQGESRKRGRPAASEERYRYNHGIDFPRVFRQSCPRKGEP